MMYDTTWQNISAFLCLKLYFPVQLLLLFELQQNFVTSACYNTLELKYTTKLIQIVQCEKYGMDIKNLAPKYKHNVLHKIPLMKN